MRVQRLVDETSPSLGTPRRTVLYAVTDPVTALAFLRGQLAYLRSAGYDVHLACGVSPELQRFAAEEGVRLHDVPLSRSWLSRRDLNALTRATRVLRHVQPDVLNYSTPKAALVWALASRRARPPFVVHLMRGLRLEGEPRWSPGFALLWLMELIAARSADRVVCVSHGLRQRARDLWLVNPDRTLVLGAGSSNGVDATRFRHSASRRRQTRERLGYTDDDLVVGFVGRLTFDKGVHDLLDAMPVCRREVKALLVGPTEPDVDLATLLAKRPGLAGRVTHIERTTSVEDYYDAMDLFVLPSLREGMSNALLEAQAMRLPCVTTMATGCRDAVEPNVTALVVKPRAPQELARVIDRLAGDPELRAEMGAAGRRRVLEHFLPAAQWKRYADLYDRAGRTAPMPGTEIHEREVV